MVAEFTKADVSAPDATIGTGCPLAQPVPSGWQPLAWNPSGTQLLMQSATSLGIWSAATPGRVRMVGVITSGTQILQAVWLSGKAPM